VRDPDAAVGIDGRAIGIALGRRDLSEYAAIADLAGVGIEVPGARLYSRHMFDVNQLLMPNKVQPPRTLATLQQHGADPR
jgi:hypothetical protein